MFEFFWIYQFYEIFHFNEWKASAFCLQICLEVDISLVFVKKLFEIQSDILEKVTGILYIRTRGGCRFRTIEEFKNASFLCLLLCNKGNRNWLVIWQYYDRIICMPPDIAELVLLNIQWKNSPFHISKSFAESLLCIRIVCIS